MFNPPAPGVSIREVAVPLTCDAPRLYADIGMIQAAVNAAVTVAIENAGLRPGTVAAYNVTRKVEQAAYGALAGRWVRADGIDPTTLCTFDGDADGELENDTITIECPTCDHTHERPYEGDLE